MLYLESITLETLPGPAVDVDVDSFRGWVAICKLASGLVVATQAGAFAAPQGLNFPLVRWTGSGDVVVVDPRTRRGRANAFVFTPDGDEKACFCVGDGVADVVSVSDRIVVTYFDEGVFGNVPPSEEGLCVFTADGQLEFGYQTGVRNPVHIDDCYCICRSGRHEVCFVPYTGFPIVRLNLETRLQSVHELPEHLAGASAVAIRGDSFLLWAPYSARRSIFFWRPRSESGEVGTHSGPLRGHSFGSFLSPGANGYTIVTAEPG